MPPRAAPQKGIMKLKEGIDGLMLIVKKLGQLIDQKDERIKEMKLEIERLKKLPDYEYVIMDIQEEIKCLKKKLEK